MEARRNPADAEAALCDHDELYALGRIARARHDVSHLHGANQSRFFERSRYGEKTSRFARPAAGRDGAFRQFAIYGWQTQWFSLGPLRDLASYGPGPDRDASFCFRTGDVLRALCRLRAVGANVFRQAR